MLLVCAWGIFHFCLSFTKFILECQMSMKKAPEGAVWLAVVGWVGLHGILMDLQASI